MAAQASSVFARYPGKVMEPTGTRGKPAFPSPSTDFGKENAVVLLQAQVRLLSLRPRSFLPGRANAVDQTKVDVAPRQAERPIRGKSNVESLKMTDGQEIFTAIRRVEIQSAVPKSRSFRRLF